MTTAYLIGEDEIKRAVAEYMARRYNFRAGQIDLTSSSGMVRAIIIEPVDAGPPNPAPTPKPVDPESVEGQMGIFADEIAAESATGDAP